MYQAEIIMGVPSDHAYGDKHGLIFLIKKKCKEKEKKKKKKEEEEIVAIATVVLRGLPKADVGRGSNTEKGIAKPVAPFHHSHRTAVNNLLQTVLRC